MQRLKFLSFMNAGLAAAATDVFPRAPVATKAPREDMKALDMSAWDRSPRVVIEDFIGQKCWIGVEASSVMDTISVVMLFEMPGEPADLALFLISITPEGSGGTIDGTALLTPGRLVEHTWLAEVVGILCETFDVQSVVGDAYQQHNALLKLRYDGRPLVTISATADNLDRPLNDLVALVGRCRIAHTDDPALRRALADFAPETGRRFPRKALMAATMANAVRLNPEDVQAAA